MTTLSMLPVALLPDELTPFVTATAMYVGTELGGRLADWSGVRTMYLGLGSTAVVLKPCSAQDTGQHGCCGPRRARGRWRCGWTAIASKFRSART